MTIIDEFTDLPISRQRKHQLRHPEKQGKYNRSFQYWWYDGTRILDKIQELFSKEIKREGG